jgi:hypothetical protein
MDDYTSKNDGYSYSRTPYLMPPQWVKMFQNMLMFVVILDMALTIIFIVLSSIGFIPMFLVKYPGLWITWIHIPTLIASLFTSLLGYEAIKNLSSGVVSDEYKRMAIFNGKVWLISAILSVITTILDIITMALLIRRLLDCIIYQTLPIQCRDFNKYLILHLVIMIIYVIFDLVGYIICHFRLYSYYGIKLYKYIK